MKIIILSLICLFNIFEISIVEANDNTSDGDSTRPNIPLHENMCGDTLTPKDFEPHDIQHETTSYANQFFSLFVQKIGSLPASQREGIESVHFHYTHTLEFPVVPLASLRSNKKEEIEALIRNTIDVTKFDESHITNLAELIFEVHTELKKHNIQHETTPYTNQLFSRLEQIIGPPYENRFFSLFVQKIGSLPASQREGIESVHFHYTHKLEFPVVPLASLRSNKKEEIKALIRNAIDVTKFDESHITNFAELIFEVHTELNQTIPPASVVAPTDKTTD